MFSTTTAAGTSPHDPRDTGRQRTVWLSIGFTLVFSLACSRWEGSDGRTAAWMDGINLGLLGGYAWRARDGALGRLLRAAGAFGVVELLADFLCVRCTATLDYSMARSWKVLESPWWMPLSWAVVAVQLGVVGDAAIRRFGWWRGSWLGALVGAGLIPAYEELAWRARWWRYRGCVCVGHTPLYIVAAEAIIGLGLAGLGYATLRACMPRATVWLGATAGLVTVLGGAVGWGLVEFIGQKAEPAWPFP